MALRQLQMAFLVIRWHEMANIVHLWFMSL